MRLIPNSLVAALMVGCRAVAVKVTAANLQRPGRACHTGMSVVPEAFKPRPQDRFFDLTNRVSRGETRWPSRPDCRTGEEWTAEGADAPPMSDAEAGLAVGG